MSIAYAKVYADARAVGGGGRARPNGLPDRPRRPASVCPVVMASLPAHHVVVLERVAGSAPRPPGRSGPLGIGLRSSRPGARSPARAPGREPSRRSTVSRPDALQAAATLLARVRPDVGARRPRAGRPAGRGRTAVRVGAPPRRRPPEERAAGRRPREPAGSRPAAHAGTRPPTSAASWPRSATGDWSVGSPPTLQDELEAVFLAGYAEHAEVDDGRAALAHRRGPAGRARRAGRPPCAPREPRPPPGADLAADGCSRGRGTRRPRHGVPAGGRR